MRIETLNERIANAKAKIERKGNTIVKKTALKEKKIKALEKMGFTVDSTDEELRQNNDAWWLDCEIRHLDEDIERINKEIPEIRASLEKYEAQLAGEIEKETVLVREIPETMKRMQTELVTEWDAWDIKRRDQIKADRWSMDYRAWCKKYNAYDKMHFMYMTDEQIHKSNEQDAKMLILNLYNRVKAITGEVTDWRGIEATIGTWGGTVLNGTVIGKEGRCSVESIYAGGYNIQRLHVRVLVHEF